MSAFLIPLRLIAAARLLYTAENWHEPQHDPGNDCGWAPINLAAKPNTFTGPGGSKRGD
jgi:hypothetical protein